MTTPVAPSPDVLRIDNLCVAYRMGGEWVDAVRGLTLSIGRSEAFGLVGESGCGKSTTAFAVMNYLGRNGRIRAGRIEFLGQDLSALSEAEVRRLRGRRMAMVYQNPQTSLNPALRVGRQIAEGVQYHEGLDRRAARDRTLEILEKVHMPNAASVLDRYPHQLSGGMQQRVLIAMALITNPDLIILDEPTTGLDVTTEAAVLDLLNELKQTFAAAILYISHNLKVVAQVCDRVGVMYAGELVETSGVAEVFARPRHPYTLDLLECIPSADKHYTRDRLRTIQGRVPLPTELPPGCSYRPRCRFAQDRCHHERPLLTPTDAAVHLARCFFSRAVASAPSQAERRAALPTDLAPTAIGGAAPLLHVDNLHKYHERQEWRLPGLGRRSEAVRAVAGVSFTVQAAETLALVGESGSGKTTLGHCIVGLLTPTEGNITFEGEKATVAVEQRPAAMRDRLQMVFQNPDSTLNPRHRIGHILERALRRVAGRPAPSPRRAAEPAQPAARRQRVTELLQAVRLDGSYADRYPDQLSGGEKQRVAIARAFASEPDLVVCDEAVSALDVSVQAAILNLLVELKQAHQCAYLFISHDLAVVRYLADRVGVMYSGQLVEVGGVEAVFSGPNHPYTEALLAASSGPETPGRPGRVPLAGPPANAAHALTGCPFHPRCPRKLGGQCETQAPPWQTVAEEHRIRCHIPLAPLAE
ncbi:MAG: ABC transporter ATP-binding protein [Anaerolineae bacterium]|nr:ABC transporter ATP-binding protein [Anaerolineae bacterium]